MSDIAIQVEGLGKRYTIGGERKPYRTLRESITGLFRRRPAAAADRAFWALRDVDFQVARGEVVGIIGRNGAGKSTLLKVLSRITEPTEGGVDINGRVGSLLEVGTGFHPELTGRENIYLNGAILGMTRAEIRGQFDAIVDFAGVGRFLDTPVKRYSSGMYVRLAFAVAAHLRTEVLIVDEVLAVGDLQFQEKCLGRMRAVSREQGRTVLFVSHNLAAVEHLCDRGLLMHAGRVAAEGRVTDVIAAYLASLPGRTAGGQPLGERTDRSGSGVVRLTGLTFRDPTTGRPIPAARSGMDLDVELAFTCPDGPPRGTVDVGLSIHTDADQTLSVLYASYVDHAFAGLPAATGLFRCRLRRLPLAAGRYRLGARVTVDGVEADWPANGIGQLDVDVGDFWRTGSVGFAAAAPLLVDGGWDLAPDGGGGSVPVTGTAGAAC